jgi:S1-C subfamily serine protease
LSTSEKGLVCLGYLCRLFLAGLVAAGGVLTVYAQDCSQVTKKYRPSVVSIEVKTTDANTGAVTPHRGTGFIIDEEGHVLTSNSLFSKNGVQLSISGGIQSQYATKEQMEFLTSSELGDVAVIRFTDTSQKRIPIDVGDPWSVQNGDPVCSMGFPLNVEFLMKPGTVTGKGASKGWWYSDIAYNDGTGGAPVFDPRKGQLIGIVGVTSGSEAGARGVGYIVPINLAYGFLHDFANIEIKRDVAQTLASGLQGLQPSVGVPTGTQVQSGASVLSGDELRDRGRSILASIWPTAQIPVCWENPSPALQREMSVVEQEVADTWEKESRLRFTGWKECARENRGLRIQINDEAPHTGGIGRNLDGLENGIVLDLTFKNFYQECQKTLDYCIRAYAGHEFGHAIGLGHTHTRPDAPPECKQKIAGSGNSPQTPEVSWQLTPYDPDSIMNFCNPKFYNDGKLSALDVETVRMLYGAPENVESGTR